MNDVERRLRDFGEEAAGEMGNELRPRPASLRRIRRRRLVASTSVLACAATIVTAGAFAWTARDASRHDAPPAPPAGEPRRVEVVTACDWVAFEPTYVPDGFHRRWRASREPRPGVIGALYRGRANAIEVTRTPAFVQTRRRPIEVLGSRATIGMIHEGWSVELHHRGCDYVVTAYGISRSQLERFARGLRAEGHPLDRHYGTIWPFEDLSDPEESCSIDMTARVEASDVAEDFLRGELGWDDPILVPPDSRSEVWTATRTAPDAYENPPRVELVMRALGPRCWAVVTAGELGADLMPRGFGVSVAGSHVYVDYAPRDALQVIADVRYGDRAPVRQRLEKPPYGPAHVDLGFEPDEPGRILVLFQDEEGNVFTAIGLSLPPGDYEI